jgi:hypothetical protein
VNTPAKLGAYGLLLAATFSGAAAIGAAAGPIDVSPTQHASHDMTKDNTMGKTDDGQVHTAPFVVTSTNPRTTDSEAADHSSAH